MKFYRLLLFFTVLSGTLCAQDSTKKFNHEIGINAVLLIKQIISDNPNSTLNQLPYTLFYNLYYKDKGGIRLGFGGSSSKSKTDIDGQNLPRESFQGSFNARVGVSYNFVHYKRLTLNAFVDGIYSSSYVSSTNTQTLTTGTPTVITLTSETSDKTIGNGAQAGIGVKFDLYRHISLYTEIPLGMLSENTTSDVKTSRTGFPSQSTTSRSKSSSRFIIIPATVYLVLRF